MWAHSSNWHDRFYRNWDDEPWAVLGVVPLLVQELALSQLRSLLAGAFQASSESAAAPAVEEDLQEQLLAGEDGRP